MTKSERKENGTKRVHRTHAYTRGCCDSPFGWTGFKDTETSQGSAKISQHTHSLLEGSLFGGS